MEKERFDESTLIDAAWGLLVDLEIATNDELDLVTRLNGYRLDVLEDVLYVKTGYRDFPQVLSSEFSKEELLELEMEDAIPFLEETLSFYED